MATRVSPLAAFTHSYRVRGNRTNYHPVYRTILRTVTKSDYRSRPRLTPTRFGFRASDFLRHSDFGIRNFLSALFLLISLGRAATNDYFKIEIGRASCRERVE